MSKLYLEQEKILEVFVIDGKKYLLGYALRELGVGIPLEQGKDLFECSQEKIDDILKRFKGAYPNIIIIQEENHQYDNGKKPNNVNIKR